MNRDSALATRRLQHPTTIAQAQPWQTDAVTLDSPALAVMTDLTKVKAATTSPATTLRQAEQLMIYQGVRMLFVVSEMPSLEGLITSTDLHGDHVMRIIQQRNARYDELTVGDVMVSRSALDAIEHEQMRRRRSATSWRRSRSTDATTCSSSSAVPGRRQRGCAASSPGRRSSASSAPSSTWSRSRRASPTSRRCWPETRPAAASRQYIRRSG